MTSKWAAVLSGGKSADDYLKKHTDYTDDELAQLLTRYEFKTTEVAVRARRLKIKVRKVQGSNQRFTPTAKESQRKNGNVWSVELDNSRIASQDEFIKKYNIDLSEWEITEFTISYHEMPHSKKATGYSGDWQRKNGDMEITPLTHIKATLKRRKDVAFAKQEIQHLVDNANKFSPKYSPIKYIKQKSGILFEPCITDHHYGRQVWHEETGYDDYDIKIADKIFDDALAGLINKTASFKFDKIVFPIGHDLFNSDNREGTTTAGTPQDNDTRYQKVFRIVEMAMFRAIDKLVGLAPVDVVVIPGNHDTLTTWLLGEVISWKYKNHKHVTVDNLAAPRKYYEWGQVMLMFLHGDKGKRAEYPNIMASEKPEMWGRTTFHEIHTGDKHQVRLEEKYGVRVRILPSLVAPDAWSSEHNFLGSQRSAEAYVWDKNEGLAVVATHTIPLRSE